MPQVSPDSGQIFFEVYVGDDLTTNQTVRAAVVFDESLSSLDKMAVLTSTAIVKTVAYVYAQNGMQIVFSPTADQAASGGQRRILLVNSNNTDPAGASLDAALQQEGLIALAAQREVYSFDGELPPGVPYVYGQDYNLGDLIEQRNSDGFGGLLLVTEQIFSSDSTGDKTYPTLSVAQIVTPGSWIAWTDGTYWADVPATDTWANP